MRILLIAIALLASAVAFGQNPFIRTPGILNCNDELLKCEYITVNVEAAVVIESLTKVISETIGCGGSQFVLCKGDSPNTIFFGVQDKKDKNFYEELKARIRLYDRLPQMNEMPIFEFSTDIYAITDQAFSRMNLELTAVGIGSKNESQDKKIESDGSGTSIGLNFGSAKFNAFIGAARGLEQVESITSVVNYVGNGQNISYQNQHDVVIPRGVTTTQTVVHGLMLDGTVRIADGIDPLIYIENFSMIYGVPNPDDRDVVTNLKSNRKMLQLRPGVAMGVASDNKTTVLKGRSLGFFKFGRSSGTSNARLLIVTRARALTFAQFVEESRQAFQHDDLNPKLSDEQIKSLGACSNLEALFENIEPFGKSIVGGLPLIVFRLKACQADSEFYERQVDIQVSAKGYKQQSLRSVQNLMAEGIRLLDIPQKLMSEREIQFKVILSARGSSRRIESRWNLNPKTFDIFDPRKFDKFKDKK